MGLSIDTVQLIGYTGSALVATSLMMNNILRLRWVNLVGASTFATYGILIGAVPVAALNSLIVLVDVVYLVILSRRRDAFSFLELPADAPFLREFLRFRKDDIERFFPGFRLEDVRAPIVRLIMRNLMPVGVFVCEDVGGGVAEIRLDYVVPGYRDFKNARFVYSAPHDQLRAAGIRSFAATTAVASHGRYLRRVGFLEDPQHTGRFLRRV